MASLRRFPRTKYWFACFTMPDGRRVQRSTRETSRTKAQAKANQFEAAAKERMKARQVHRVLADIYRAAHNEELPDSTARTFFATWLARRKHETKLATWMVYRRRVHVFEQFLGVRADRPLGEIAREDIQRFRDSEVERVAAATTNVTIKILRAIFEDARRDNLISDNPAKDVRSLESSPAQRRPFTVEELRAIVAHADPEWRSLVHFGLYCGLRLSDIALLTWQNVDWAADEIRLRTGKTGRVVAIPISSPLRRHIEANLTAGDDPTAPVHPRAYRTVALAGRTGTLSNQFAALLAVAGLAEKRTHAAKDKQAPKGSGRRTRRASSQVSFHSLRHTATSLMKNAGISPAIVQDIIGHDSAEMSAHYTKIESASKRKALEALPDLD